MMTMVQRAPRPDVLFDLVGNLAYKRGWRFWLDEELDRGQGSEGLTFVAQVTTDDGYHPERKRSVVHYMIVPAAAFDRRAWTRWLLDQILMIESHEACEFFRFEDPAEAEPDFRPFAPNHGPGRNPYEIVSVGTDVDVRTSFTGAVNPS